MRGEEASSAAPTTMALRFMRIKPSQAPFDDLRHQYSCRGFSRRLLPSGHGSGPQPRFWLLISAEQPAYGYSGGVAQRGMGEDRHRAGHLIGIDALFDGHFVLNPAGKRDVAEEDSLLADKHFAGHEKNSVLARVVALLDVYVGQELVHCAAARGFFVCFE